MKRSKPLTRRTPLRRSAKALRKSGLACVSDKKRDWLDLYQKKKDETLGLQGKCAACLNWFHSSKLEPHHPAGRANANILRFVWLCKKCHTWIHDHGKESREVGFLLPEFEGRKSNANTKNFFGV